MAKSLGARFSFPILVFMAIVGLYMADATDPGPLQDFCVGVTNPNTACTYTLKTLHILELALLRLKLIFLLVNMALN